VLVGIQLVIWVEVSRLSLRHLSKSYQGQCELLGNWDQWWGTLEWHLVICQSCRDRLEAEMEFVTTRRDTATKIRRVNVDRSGHEGEENPQANRQD
jgi:hypothetical protein